MENTILVMSTLYRELNGPDVQLEDFHLSGKI